MDTTIVRFYCVISDTSELLFVRIVNLIVSVTFRWRRNENTPEIGGVTRRGQRRTKGRQSKRKMDERSEFTGFPLGVFSSQVL